MASGPARLAFLGGLTARQFLRRHWQKRPLFVPQAFPGFAGVLSPDELAGLACRDDVRARLVELRRGTWRVEQGPFDPRRFRTLPPTRWSLLVQDVNQLEPAAERLLQQFAFIPHARLDDLMVSYAPRGGSVGPHVDSYDVFLIQAMGHRRWQVSCQSDRRLVEGAPLRILQRFAPEEEWVAAPGDLLYLPPGYAHHGVAEDDCMTCSVGFRAPSAEELSRRFLEWLADHLHPEGRYEDPDLEPARHPSLIGDDMVRRVSAMLGTIRWDRGMVARFLGQYLSEPQAHVLFERPARPLTATSFARRAGHLGVRLAARSLMLCHDGRFFLNGEVVVAPPGARAALLRLADERRLPPAAARGEALLGLLHRCYRDGYLHLGAGGPAQPAPRRRSNR